MNINNKTNGQIHVYTGDGKGKTTAALGLALRAAGHGKRVAIIFFDKGGILYGERQSLLKLAPQVDFFVTGNIRFQLGQPFRFGVTSADKKEAVKGLQLARALFKMNYDLIILDEINITTALGMLDVRDVIKVIRGKPQKTELVLTGRRAPKEIIAMADLMTEMTLRKHYMTKGIPARQGIEY